MKIPPPVFFRSIEAASPSQEKPLENALNTLKLEDPSFNYSTDPESGQVSFFVSFSIFFKFFFEQKILTYFLVFFFFFFFLFRQF